MSPFANLRSSDIPPAAKVPAEAVTRMFGFLPNVVIQMAQSPVALEKYLANLQAFGDTTFTPVEQQIVLLTASVANGSPYSVAVHSMLASRTGVNASVIQAIRDRHPVPDSRVESLRHFAEAVTLRWNDLPESEISGFLKAGFSRQQIVEVVHGIAVKTFAHVLQAIAKPELDEVFVPFAWNPPT